VVALNGKPPYLRLIHREREESPMSHVKRMTALSAVVALSLAACGGQAADAPAEYSIQNQPQASASFVSPSDGETVSAPLRVVLRAEGVQLTPAGIPAVGEGHLHVMVDIGCYETGEFILGPSEQDEAAGRFHLGDGSDSREIPLEPGTYELCVQLGDGAHMAFGETQTITVTVE
jgi:hypothetical protein